MTGYRVEITKVDNGNLEKTLSYLTNRGRDIVQFGQRIEQLQAENKQLEAEIKFKNGQYKKTIVEVCEAVKQIKQLRAKNKRLKRQLEIGYENFKIWYQIGAREKRSVCMGETERVQYFEILEALKG